MIKKIVVNSKELIVEDLYPYRYESGKGKEVLRIKISDANHTFEDVKVLDNVDVDVCPVIEYLEDDEKMVEYVGYNADFSINYVTENGVRIFSIEVVRKGATELALDNVIKESKNNKETVEEIVVQTTSNKATIDELSVMISELTFGALYQGGVE